MPSTSTSSPALAAVSLSRHFRSVEAVADVSVLVEPGEVVGVLGPNGSGKSTTMKLVAGVLRPTGGTVSVAGVDALTHPLAAKRLTGFVPDVGGLFPRLTGWDHLELAARTWDLDGWVPRAKALLSRLDLVDAAGRRSSTYSHGMSRKLSVAVALLPRPRLLLLDEPFDGVDPTGSAAIRELVEEEVAAGTGVLVSTHLLPVAERFCDRVLVVRAGRVVVEGTPSEVVAGAGDLEEAYLSLLRPAP